MTETWVLVFYVTFGFEANVPAGPALLDGFKERQACIDTALQIEQAWSVKWICVSKKDKP